MNLNTNEYLNKIHELLGQAWHEADVAENTARLNAYIELIKISTGLYIAKKGRATP